MARMLLNMKKILIIIPILIILSLGGWILFRKIGAPMEETTSTESPFGSPNEQGEEMLTNDNPPLASIGTTTAEESISQNKAFPFIRSPCRWCRSHNPFDRLRESKYYNFCPIRRARYWAHL